MIESLNSSDPVTYHTLTMDRYPKRSKNHMWRSKTGYILFSRAPVQFYSLSFGYILYKISGQIKSGFDLKFGLDWLWLSPPVIPFFSYFRIFLYAYQNFTSLLVCKIGKFSYKTWNVPGRFGLCYLAGKLQMAPMISIFQIFWDKIIHLRWTMRLMPPHFSHLILEV